MTTCAHCNTEATHADARDLYTINFFCEKCAKEQIERDNKETLKIWRANKIVIDNMPKQIKAHQSWEEFSKLATGDL